ncbi:chemotaxis protein CheW [Mesorhizobium sp.]|uniref:chemotaxis protein CheW n=1 Tax=Mesorhizobium sp. TaxID=1871066 RepID=UPI001210290A|nr:chemotaxis protein CheW [Mesorhizobium sp.]TIS86806.1 MAG: chemotaxis protein CheW [Mesorhizobium sp.]TJW47927.1 MAG: chemotaxis protein CheW [Mesorhizobium sp.]
MRPAEIQENGDILAFEVAGQRYGVLLAQVVEVLRGVTVAKLLKAPPAIEGIVNLRGTIVPVLDIRTRFGLPRKDVEPADRMIVVRAGRRHAILRVDRTVSIIAVGADIFDKGKAASSRSGHIKGTMKLPDGLLVVYDLDTFLSVIDAEMFDWASAEAKA